MKVLVTGAEGFVGTHLCAALERRGHIPIPTSASGNVGHPLLLPQLDGLRKLLLSTRPDAVIHLAGIAFVPQAHREPAKAYEVNVEGTANLYRTVQDVLGGCGFLFVSSAGVYGKVALERQPIDEQLPPAPVNVYGWSKLAAETSLQTLAMAYDTPLVVTRPFNHTGPGQDEQFVLPAFASQLSEIERGAEPVLHVGNLEVTMKYDSIMPQVILQMFSRKKLFRQDTLTEPQTLKFQQLLPGKYSFKVVVDHNANGEWDPGEVYRMELRISSLVTPLIRSGFLRVERPFHTKV